MLGNPHVYCGSHPPPSDPSPLAQVQVMSVLFAAGLFIVAVEVALMKPRGWLDKNWFGMLWLY